MQKKKKKKKKIMPAYATIVQYVNRIGQKRLRKETRNLTKQAKSEVIIR